jgi:hypothetical protein
VIKQLWRRRRIQAGRSILPALGIPAHRKTIWDADHIVPVEHGGGECDLANYQTLCWWCHAEKTKYQATLVDRVNKVEKVAMVADDWIEWNNNQIFRHGGRL